MLTLGFVIALLGATALAETCSAEHGAEACATSHASDVGHDPSKCLEDRGGGFEFDSDCRDCTTPPKQACADGYYMNTVPAGQTGCWEITCTSGGFPETPDDVLPGIASELSKGLDISNGDPHNLTKRQIFLWTYDQGRMDYWNTKEFAIPDQVAIHFKNVCTVSEVETSSFSTSHSESTSSQGSSWSGGFDQKSEIGVEYEGVGISTQIQNSLMFGNSKVTSDYESQSSQGRTMSMQTVSRAEAYNSQLYDDHIEDSWFHPYFKMAALRYAKTCSKEAAYDFFDAYGTHFIQEAELGGSAERNVYFEEHINESSAQHYFEEHNSAGGSWLWFGGSKSDSEMTSTTNSQGESGSVYTSSTYIVGGDPGVETPGDFCASLQKYMTPRVQAFKRLVPIANIIERVTGVPAGTGAKMKATIDKFWEEGEKCALDTCAGGISMCSWNSRDRSWGTPCKCLSRSIKEKNLNGVTQILEKVVFKRRSGVKATFAGWSIRKLQDDHSPEGVTIEDYEIQMDGDCFVYDDGTLGRAREEFDDIHGKWHFWEVQYTVNVGPRKAVEFCAETQEDDCETLSNTSEYPMKVNITKDRAGGKLSWWTLQVIEHPIDM